MVKNELFFHQAFHNPHFARSLGFSARFTPAATATDEQGHPVVQMSLCQCNKQDKTFSKKFARNLLRSREGQTVRVRDIPTLMSVARFRAVAGGFAEPSEKTIKTYAEDYNFLLRKFL